MATRHISPLVAIALSISSTCASMASACPGPTGDVNFDGVMNISDVQCLILASLAVLQGPSAALPACLAVDPAEADVNCEGGIDTSDIMLGIAFLLGSKLNSAVDSDGSGCVDACEDPCLATTASSCCCPSGGAPGCDDVTCEALVCTLDPHCCDTAWDTPCVDAANAFCALCGGQPPACLSDADCLAPDACTTAACALPAGAPPGSGQCQLSPVSCDDGDPCTADTCIPTGPGCMHQNQCSDGCTAAGVPTCGGCGCQACVCALEPSCCTTAWDDGCAALCDLECGSCGSECGDGACESSEGETLVSCAVDCTGAAECCGAQPTQGCSDSACQQCVCEADAFCCSTSWDSLCVEETSTLCEVACGCGDQPCCYASAGMGCGDAGCEGCVCDMDPRCCDAAWDELCASAAAVACAAACPCAGTPNVPPCCGAKGEPGCGDDPDCESCVCQSDSYCCESAWDEPCVTAARGTCAANCNCP